MPVEFRCTKCGKLLRTPDDSRGKQARCPECGTIAAVPAKDAGDFAAEPLAAAATLSPFVPTAANPYQAPMTERETPVVAGSKLDFGTAFARSWWIFRRRAGICIAVVLLAFALNFGLALGVNQLRTVLIPLVGESAVAILAVCQIAGILFQWWLTAGQTRFFLNVARGMPAKITNLFAGTRWFLSVLAATILFFLAVVVGFVLLLVPGMIVAMTWSQYLWLIVDRDLGPLEALRKSREIMRGNKATLFAIYLAVFAPAFICSIAAAFIAPHVPWSRQFFPQLPVLFVMPWFNVLAAVCYLLLTGQATADQVESNSAGA